MDGSTALSNEASGGEMTSAGPAVHFVCAVGSALLSNVLIKALAFACFPLVVLSVEVRRGLDAGQCCLQQWDFR